MLENMKTQIRQNLKKAKDEGRLTEEEIKNIVKNAVSEAVNVAKKNR